MAAEGVPNSSLHEIAPWCTPAQMFTGKLVDGLGNPLRDIDFTMMCAAATELLFWLSGRKYRTGHSIVRPARVSNPNSSWAVSYPWNSAVFQVPTGWAWPMIGLGWSMGENPGEVVLQGPVTSITSVVVDGVTLDESEYTLYDGRRLVRNIGASGQGGAWPWNQSLLLPVSEPGTWQIDYEWGTSPPRMGVLSAAELSTELALLASGQDKSRLPARVMSIATEGVTVAVGDALSFLKESLTGLPICDAFLKATNPTGRRKRSVFLSPEVILNRST